MKLIWIEFESLSESKNPVSFLQWQNNKENKSEFHDVPNNVQEKKDPERIAIGSSDQLERRFAAFLLIVLIVGDVRRLGLAIWATPLARCSHWHFTRCPQDAFTGRSNAICCHPVGFTGEGFSVKVHGAHGPVVSLVGSRWSLRCRRRHHFRIVTVTLQICNTSIKAQLLHLTCRSVNLPGNLLQLI